MFKIHYTPDFGVMNHAYFRKKKKRNKTMFSLTFTFTAFFFVATCGAYSE